MRISRLLLPLLFAITALMTMAASAQALPAGWTIYPVPIEDSETLRCANYSSLEWRVSLSQSRTVQITVSPSESDSEVSKQDLPPAFKRQKGMVGRQTTMRIQNGWLLGFDGGEFGGGLWFTNSKGNSRQLSPENVHGLTKTPRGVLAFVGLAHMSLDSGRVLLVPYEVDSQSVETLTKLDGAPEALTQLSPEAVLVVTTKGVSQINASGESKNLLRRNFGGLYPNSVLSTPNGVIYIGMRLFVVRLLPQNGNYAEQWLLPDRCKHFRVQAFDCACTK